ncbi:flagellar motor protein MotB [Hephaestia mangrovi]|uniref:flagellar motor protein MotB n=1 Tax=Hephaestia mangrovi TaxID=2873268 RepID=UPI001CA68BD3|nr:flagellar motor protein MotB [Hephaestia mangrovi]MBY8829273.1 flagellar motor protein MotB [Hephaestia mangrovi]
MTTADDFPETPGGRPVWLITLADLALLLVGFFVFIQANSHLDGHKLAQGFRAGFGIDKAPAAEASPDPMPVAAAAMLDFAPGSATLPQSPAGLVAWARAAAADPRVTLKVSGETDGSTTDIDPASGSRAVLAADRARAVAAALAAAHVVQPGRLTIVNAPESAGKGRRAVLVTLGFVGDRQ